MASRALATSSRKSDWFILSSLVSKDFKLKYRRSVLGVAWSVLNPLLMMCVLSIVFSFMFRYSIENYPMYLILGTILFNFMSGATSQGMTSIIGSASLIKKIRINKIVFPLEKVVFELVNFVVSLVAVVIVMAWFRIPPTPDLLLLPVLMIYTSLFSMGLSLLLSALAVFFRDVIHLWSVIITAWTYATPIFYPMELLPAELQTVMGFNPMYHYITYFRDIAMYGNTPGIAENAVCLGMALVTLGIGYAVFTKTQKKFILYV